MSVRLGWWSGLDNRLRLIGSGRSRVRTQRKAEDERNCGRNQENDNDCKFAKRHMILKQRLKSESVERRIRLQKMKQVLREKAARARFKATFHRWLKRGHMEGIKRSDFTISILFPAAGLNS